MKRWSPSIWYGGAVRLIHARVQALSIISAILRLQLSLKLSPAAERDEKESERHGERSSDNAA
eukprot:3935246-Pleurochrysis_carterae.AAC.1